MKIGFLFACVLAVRLACVSASAQTVEVSELPDPATIRVPDVVVGAPERDGAGETKYFYFHKPGVSFEVAVADLRECVSYAAGSNNWPRMPGWVATQDLNLLPPSRQKERLHDSPYGLVGTMMSVLIGPALERTMFRRAGQSNMRMCMGFKNYRRYPLSKDAYLAITERAGEDAVFIQAKIASGPTPLIESLVP